MTSAGDKRPRGNNKLRGLGAEHQKLREQWRPIVDSGGAWCQQDVCVNPDGRWIRPGTEWHLAHTSDRSAYLGPAHAVCNLADGGRRSRGPRSAWRSQQAPPAQMPTSRDW